jgi:release factor glutamine methyltransferase
MFFYQPEEDSYLMSDILKKEFPKLLIDNSNLKVLEIGAGSGIQLETLFNIGIKKQNIFACDINLNAVKNCKHLGFNCIGSYLFEKIKGKFEFIIFNPPYLPKDKKEPYNSKIATTGGRKGSEIINKFLKQAKNYLESNGKIFLITSSLTENINWLNWEKKIIGKKKLFFEELYVWELFNHN